MVTVTKNKKWGRTPFAALLCLALALPAFAQPGKLYRIGMLEVTPENANRANLNAFLEGLRKAGYGEGENYLGSDALAVAPWSSFALVVVGKLVEEPEPGAPFGAKGVGEPPTISSTAAVAAAIRNATGLELPRVPVRPQDIALASGGAGPS